MSLEPIKQDLFKKAANFNQATDEIELIKQIIIDKTRIGVRITSIKHQVIHIKAESFAAANDLFMQKEELLNLINQKSKEAYKKITVSA